MTDEFVLEVQDLVVEVPEVGGVVNRVVNNVSFEVPRGKVVGLLGESGSGKSSVVLACMGLNRNQSRIVGGSVRLDGRELLGLTLEEWEKVRGVEIGLVTQTPRASLNPVMPIGKQISQIYRVHTGATKEQARQRALELLSLVGINDPVRRLSAFPQELSGGMAQRTVIAMALACSPRLLFADEPTSGLDVTVRTQILDDLVASVRAVGSGLVVVTQDLSVIANYCDRVFLLHAGEIVEEADVDRFFENPHHPSTLSLLAAQRHSGVERFRLRGLPVDTRQLPDGCYAAARCKFADAAAGCTSSHPDLDAIGSNHRVRCFCADQVGAAASREWPLGGQHES